MCWCLILLQPSKVSVIIINLQVENKETNLSKVKQLVSSGLEI